MPGKSLRFIVHEHKSRRLHYDFRLEIGGVLKSWAIPKGPSMNPSDKRLAIMVSDHILEYYDYEGIIPDGQYGAGPVVIWDSGEFIPLDAVEPNKMLMNGKLSFELRGDKLKGVFTLTRMKELPKGTGKEWLIMKKKDAHALSYFALKTELTPARLNALKVRIPPCETE